MYKIFINDNDITENVRYNSVRITEHLNDRPNSAVFRTMNAEVEWGSTVRIYETMVLPQGVTSGDTFTVLDTYAYYENFRVWDEIIVDPEWSNREYAIITNINHDNKQVTLDRAITLQPYEYIGRLIFAGTVVTDPDEQMWHLEEFEKRVQCTDWATRMNAKNVVQRYENMYTRELVSRALYTFVANIQQQDLDQFESARTHGGVARPMQNNTDRVQGQFSQQTGITWAWTWTRTQTITSTDITDADMIRLWHKIKTGQGAAITSMKYRVGNDASNYLERQSMYTWSEDEDCWTYESFFVDRADETGSVDLEDITRLQIEIVGTGSIPQDGILFDHSLATEWGFALRSARWEQKFLNYPAPHMRLSEVLENVSKRQGLFRRVDYNKVIRIFTSNETLAPFGLDDSSENYGDLSIKIDRSMLRNRATVSGGDSPSTQLFTEDEVNDGLRTQRQLSYWPSELQIFVALQDVAVTNATRSTGIATITTASAHGLSPGDEIAITSIQPVTYTGSFTVISTPTSTEITVSIWSDPGAYVSGGFVGEFMPRTVGVENLVDPSTVDYVFNFQERIVRSANAPVLPEGSVFRRRYFPFQPIRVRLSDNDSIAAIQALEWWGDGIVDGPLITDTSLRTFQDVRERARAELNAYANPIVSATFVTNKAWLQAGQIISITDSARSLDQEFLIQKVVRTSKADAKCTFEIECASSIFGIIEFFQLLLRQGRRLDDDTSEPVDVIVNQDETISLIEQYTFDVKTNVYTAAATRQNKRFDFIENIGSATTSSRIFNDNRDKNNMRQATITSNCNAEVWFDDSSRYNTEKELYIDVTDYDGDPTWESAQASLLRRLPAQANTSYSVSARIENLILTGLIGGVWLTISIEEYEDPQWWSPLATTNIVGPQTDVHDRTYYENNFTTHADTAYMDLIIKVEESVGKVSVWSIRIIENTNETETNPGIASYAEAT